MSSTIPGSPSPLTSALQHSPLQPLTSVPLLPSSVSSSADIATPTSISLRTESSSWLGRTLSIYSSSSMIMREDWKLKMLLTMWGRTPPPPTPVVSFNDDDLHHQQQTQRQWHLFWRPSLRVESTSPSFFLLFPFSKQWNHIYKVKKNLYTQSPSHSHITRLKCKYYI